MSFLMETERIRLVILTSEEVRQALKIAAAEEGVEPSEAADAILRAALTTQIEKVRARQTRKDKKKGGA